MMMRTLVFAIAFLLPGFASAQSVELFALTGTGQLWDDEGRLGVGLPLGAGVGFTSPHAWGIELVAETQTVKRSFDSGVSFDSTVTAARARVLKYFGSGRSQPYAGGSLGVTRVRSTRGSPAGCALVNNVFTCTGRDVLRSESNAGALSGFAGVRISAGNVMFVRPEFELWKAGEHMRISGLVAVGASW